MFEQSLKAKNVPLGRKIGYKTMLAAAFVALAVALPQIVHLALGQPGGVKWLPMYLPVVLSGLVLGWRVAFAVGVSSPLVSFLITSALGSPMPPAARLPYMAAELAVFAVVAGLFSKLIYKNALWAIPAAVAPIIAGRAAFEGLVALFGKFSGFTVPMIFSQIVAGIPGAVVIAVAAPLIAIGARALLRRG